MLRVISLGLLFSLSALAEPNYTHEVYVGTGGGSFGVISFQPGQSGYAIATGYNYRSNTSFQIGADLNFAYYSSTSYSTNASTGFSLLVGPTYNFAEDKGDIANSYFLSFQYGLLNQTNSYSDPTTPYSSNTVNDGTWVATVGKRFKLAENVSFRPMVRCIYTAPVNYVVFQIVPLSLGVNF